MNLSYPVQAIVLLLSAILLLGGYDQPVFIFLNTGALHANAFWANATFMGDTVPLILILGLFAWYYPRLLWAGFIGVLVVGLGIQAAKHILDVMRPAAVLAPEFINIVGPTLKSRAFPSGHTAAAFAIAALLCNQFKHVQSQTTIVILASVIGLSRIMVGAHWPSDVLVGALAGWHLGNLSYFIARRISWGYDSASGRAFCGGFYGLAVMLSFGHTGGYNQALALSETLSVISLIVVLPYFLKSIGVKPPRFYCLVGDRAKNLTQRAFFRREA